jgi:hypothetical protein
VSATEVDLDYVLWTDPDVIFLEDIDSCTLPRPRILSVGPDAAMGGVGNCGVIYFNVETYTRMFPVTISFFFSFWVPVANCRGIWFNVETCTRVFLVTCSSRFACRQECRAVVRRHARFNLRAASNGWREANCVLCNTCV